MREIRRKEEKKKGKIER